MMVKKTAKIIVYYDAACPKCVKDRQNYEQMAGDSAGDVCWMDITGRENELRRLGINPQKALTELHVKDQNGQILSEIDAYILLMHRVPRLRPIAWLIGLPIIRPIAAFLYHHMVNRRLDREGRL
jgi:predicted DCC family thiol-disulfide oxidoreductase YuxK